MLTENDKRARAALFRQRLARAMEDCGLSQAELARQAGVDRSTISQLLAETGARLPNAQVVAECARATGISTDWLLGLTDRPERAADLLAATMSVTEAPRSPVDEQMRAWHEEAAGYKIRHVPASLPDMLKTREMLRWEYADAAIRTSDQAIGATEDRLDWIRSTRSDYEIALPLHEMQVLARGEGYYADLPADLRADQLAHMEALTRQLYPGLRVYLFDARRVFSAPITLFGPLLAVLYLGRHFLAFRERGRIATFTAHFDWLVREAETGARDFPDLAARLAREAMIGGPEARP